MALAVEISLNPTTVAAQLFVLSSAVCFPVAFMPEKDLKKSMLRSLDLFSSKEI